MIPDFSAFNFSFYVLPASTDSSRPSVRSTFPSTCISDHTFAASSPDSISASTMECWNSLRWAELRVKSNCCHSIRKSISLTENCEHSLDNLPYCTAHHDILLPSGTCGKLLRVISLPSDWQNTLEFMYCLHHTRALLSIWKRYVVDEWMTCVIHSHPRLTLMLLFNRFHHATLELETFPSTRSLLVLSLHP